MSDAWAKAVAEIAALLKRWGAAIAAYFAGRKAGEDKAEDAAREAIDEARNDQNESDRAFERLRSDESLLERLRAIRKRRKDAAAQ